MTPRAIRAQTRVLCAALVLALASGGARAGELYRWVTKDGRVEIGTSPPFGAAAEPYFPGQEAAAQPAAPAAPAPAPVPAETPRPAAGHSTREAERGARGRLEEPCARDQEISDKATQKIRILEAQIARLEHKLDELEANEVAYSQTSCRSQGIEGPSSDCLTSSFHRDAEISSTQQELEDAQQKLADLEQRARAATTDERCAPAAPEK